MRGFLLIDKKKGMTSFDVVAKVRRLTGEKRIGHAGTLDPMATGLLLIAVGEGTKLLEYFVGCDKEYEVCGKFGEVSDTYDAEGRISGFGVSSVNEKEMAVIINKNFLGEIEQVPPKFSAIKIGGRKACDIARRGGDVELKSRKIRIDGFEISDFDWPSVRFLVKCGSGTYIRSLIHDLGQKLGCGAYVTELRRTRVGRFLVENSCKMGGLGKKVEQDVISLEEIASDFDCLELSDEDFEGLRDGKVLANKKIEQGGPVMVFYKGKLAGVVEDFQGEGIKFKKRVF